MAKRKVEILCVVLLIMMAMAEATPPGIADDKPSSPEKAPAPSDHRSDDTPSSPKKAPAPSGDSSDDTPSSPKKAPAPSDDTPSPPSRPTSSPVPPTPSLPPSVPPTVTPPPPTPSTPSPVPPTPSSPSPPSVPSAPSLAPPINAPPPRVPSGPPKVPPTPLPSPPSKPSTPFPSPSPATNTPSPLSPSTPSPAPPPKTPSPVPPTPSSPSPPSVPSTPSPVPPTPSSPSPPYPTSTAQCKNKIYRHCYNVKHFCPASCPGGCEVDCVTCKPVCRCDRPGAVCQDPRFIGGNGVTFYFHGKKDRDFCLVSDSNLHINAHFIGRRNDNMRRDFTWVQSIAILFGKHRVYIGALKTSTWVDSVDRLIITVDGQPISLPNIDGASRKTSNLSIARTEATNGVVVEADGNFKITAKVVPITEEDSRIHNYGVTTDDCFAHLDLGFKFYALSDGVDGVLGQTYRPGYVSRVNIGAKMPVMGGDREFKTSNLFAADCAVARFDGGSRIELPGGVELPGMSCASGIDGQGVGVVCKR